jgi:hypothetical protein
MIKSNTMYTSSEPRIRKPRYLSKNIATCRHNNEQAKKVVKAATEPVSKQLPLEQSTSEHAIGLPAAAGRPLSTSWRRPALVVVKVVHSLIYFFIEFCMGYLIYAGLKGREDRRTAIAAGVVAGESFIFLGNRCRCPLTGVAEDLGASRGSVTDIYLPRWLASNIFPLHVPLLALVLCLHSRNFLRWSK